MEQGTGLDLLYRTGLVAIVRGIPEQEALHVAKALYDGGVRVMEITMNTGGAARMIATLREAYDDRMWIGAGTVIGPREAEEAAVAGAQFYVTPNVCREVIEYGSVNAIPVCAGAMTPTEIVQAHAYGATVVKVFPCGSLGVSYIKELQGPLSHIPMMAVGGVTLSNAQDFIRAGVRAVGIGSNLVSRKAAVERDYDGIRRLASEYTDTLRGVLSHD